MEITLHSTNSSRITQPLFSPLDFLSRDRLDGQLDIQADSGHKWSLFFYLGRLVWATGGLNPVRHWRRLVAQHCPQIAPNSISLQEKEKDEFKCWDYHILTVLLQQQKITEEQAIAMIESSITEVLFDIAQQSEVAVITSTIKQQNALDNPLTLIDVEKATKQAYQDWESWRNAGLGMESPNLAPVLRRPSLLRQQTSADVYQNFVTLVNGKHTLRDLAVQIKQDLLLLTRSLIPYIRRGLVELIEIDDLPLSASTNPTAATNTPSSSVSPTGSLLARIDYSSRTCHAKFG